MFLVVISEIKTNRFRIPCLWTFCNRSVQWNNDPRVHMSHHSNTLFWFWVFALTSYWYMFSGVATNTNSIVFDLHRPHDITIYHTHANHNNADVVLRKRQCTTAPNEKNAI